MRAITRLKANSAHIKLSRMRRSVSSIALVSSRIIRWASKMRAWSSPIFSARRRRLSRMSSRVRSRAARKRRISSSTFSRATTKLGTTISRGACTYALPSAIPGETAMPRRRISFDAGFPAIVPSGAARCPGSMRERGLPSGSILVEAVIHELHQLVDGSRLVGTFGGDDDRSALRCAQGREAEDALAVHRRLVREPHEDARGELRRTLHEDARRAQVQT